MTTPPIPPASPEEPGRASVPPAEAVTPEGTSGVPENTPTESASGAPAEPVDRAAPQNVPVGTPVEPTVLPSESIASLPSYPTGSTYSATPVHQVGPPPPPGEPYNPWAAPSQRVHDPASPYGSPPVPPHRTSNAPLVVGLVLGFLLLLTLGAVFFAVVDRNVEIATPTRTTAPRTYAVPTTNPTPLPPPAQVGDCVKLSGPSFNPVYEKQPCESGLHNYTVSKVPGAGEKCGDDPDAYVKYRGWDGRKSSNVCLIPVFVDGQCYDLTLASLDAEFKKADCSFLVVRAKVLPNTVDKAACGPNPALALAYPEIKTTYCFSQAE